MLKFSLFMSPDNTFWEEKVSFSPESLSNSLEMGWLSLGHKLNIFRWLHATFFHVQGFNQTCYLIIKTFKALSICLKPQEIQGDIWKDVCRLFAILCVVDINERPAQTLAGTHLTSGSLQRRLARNPP